MSPVPIALPVGPTPGWEIEEAEKDGSSLKSISDSLVILQALRQSREQWLSSNFALFSSHVRNTKLPDVTPPPHTCVPLGQCDVMFGPIIFYGSSLFEIRYPSPSALLATSTSVYNPATTPSATSGVVVTPELLAQVNAAASTNPTLAKLLQLAATGHATAEQIRTLGLLIQQLAVTVGQSSNSTSYSPPGLSAIDLVIEYRERPGQRFLIPRKYATCERISTGAPSLDFCELLVTLAIYPPLPVQEGGSITGETSSPVPVKMELKKVPFSMSSFLDSWVDSSKKEDNAQFMESMLSSVSRVYLAHQISQGPLLTQLQAANASPYTMRSLNPNNNPPRRMRRRKVQLPNLEADQKDPKASADVDASEDRRKIREMISKKPRTESMNGYGNTPTDSLEQAKSDTAKRQSVSFDSQPPTTKKRRRNFPVT